MWHFEEDKTASIITPAMNIRHQSGLLPQPPLRLPETAVLIYLSGGVEHVTATRKCKQVTEKLPCFLQGGPVYATKKICFLDGGRGAPQAIDTLETLAALGVKRVFSVGTCAAFAPGISMGDILVPPRAFVEEGTSLHYYPDIDHAVPDAALYDVLCAIPEAKQLPIVSTDAIYRRTFYKEALWRKKGAVAVDMETSALMSVGAYRGIAVASALIVSDVHPLREGDPAWAWHMTSMLRAHRFDTILRTIGL